MKKILLISVLVFALATGLAFAGSKSYSSYEQVADGQIIPKGGAVTSLLIITDGSNDATVILYDVDAAGDIATTNKLIEVTVNGIDDYGGKVWTYPVIFTEGLYADVTGTGASYIIEWIK